MCVLPCQRSDIKKVKTDEEYKHGEVLQQGHDAPKLCSQVSVDGGDYFPLYVCFYSHPDGDRNVCDGFI